MPRSGGSRRGRHAHDLPLDTSEAVADPLPNLTNYRHRVSAGLRPNPPFEWVWPFLRGENQRGHENAAISGTARALPDLSFSLNLCFNCVGR